jgi:hypothetical protein
MFFDQVYLGFFPVFIINWGYKLFVKLIVQARDIWDEAATSDLKRFTLATTRPKVNLNVIFV